MNFILAGLAFEIFNILLVFDDLFYFLSVMFVSLKAIEKSIVGSDLGMTPNNDGEVIRLTLPQLTSERKKV